MPTLRVDDSPAALPREAWNRLLAASPRPTPFMRHEYLQALHDSGSAIADTGWQPQFLSLWQGDELLAACPAYLKGHSYGEYVALCRTLVPVRLPKRGNLNQFAGTYISHSRP